LEPSAKAKRFQRGSRAPARWGAFVFKVFCFAALLCLFVPAGRQRRPRSIGRSASAISKLAGVAAPAKKGRRARGRGPRQWRRGGRRMAEADSPRRRRPLRAPVSCARLLCGVTDEVSERMRGPPSGSRNGSMIPAVASPAGRVVLTAEAAARLLARWTRRGFNAAPAATRRVSAPVAAGRPLVGLARWHEGSRLPPLRTSPSEASHRDIQAD
jgi:hypothetical protein